MNAAQEAIDIVACAAEEARDQAEQLGERAAALYRDVFGPLPEDPDEHIGATEAEYDAADAAAAAADAVATILEATVTLMEALAARTAA